MRLASLCEHQNAAEASSVASRRLEESELPGEAKQHERRAEKAAYLKRKLAERARAERERDTG